MRRSLVVVLVLLALSVCMKAQTVTQVGFKVKQVVTDVENIAVVIEASKYDDALKQARIASIAVKKKFSVYKVANLRDIASTINAIKRMKKTAVIFYANNTIMSVKSLKYMSNKLILNKIPVISTRQGDTKEGAFMSVFKMETALQTNISQRAVKALKINLAPSLTTQSTVVVP